MAGTWWVVLLVIPLLASSITAEDCDDRCATKNCDEEGACICELPSNSSILQGDRSFMGGQYCDVARIMCDGTNSFWCENGHCNEIIQGENYTCSCSDGFAGEHCELEGTACGDAYCYNNGECNSVDSSCDCPADWRGSSDCSLSTVKSSKTIASPPPTRKESQDNNSWYFPVFVALAVVAVAAGLVLGLKSMRKRSKAATEFHKLRQVQMRGFIEEDEDAFAHAPLSKAELV